MDGWLRGKSVGWLIECGEGEGEGEEERGRNDYGIAVMNEAIGTLHPAYIWNYHRGGCMLHPLYSFSVLRFWFHSHIDCCTSQSSRLKRAERNDRPGCM